MAAGLSPQAAARPVRLVGRVDRTSSFMANAKMRAVGVVPGSREVRLIEHEAPGIPSPHQVRIRSLEVGVCGTDREICTFVYGSPPNGFDYLVLGHESLGQVVEVGDGVSGL